ncbi:phosphatidylethanolamine N-methyltransferase [Flavobacteriaceae bacterium UJ101]|nr:phosphatidylethanolamine N-methyltransferase [Flavobacteriaceae bacterium UJ101]
MQTSRFYNSIAPLYSAIDFFLKPQKKILLQEINALPKGNILEIGAGSTHLNSYKNHNVTVIDLSEAMIKKAKTQQNSHTFFLMDGEHTSFSDYTFDYIVMSHVLSVTQNPNQMILEAYRLLKPHGKLFILNHFTPNNFLHYIDYGFHSISSLFHFKSYFKIDTLAALNSFQKEKEISLGKLNYYKLIIFKKG